MTRVEQGVKNCLNQMQLEVDICRLGTSTDDQKADKVLEDNIRWAVLDLFGEKLNGFLKEVFADISFGSAALLKELESKAVRKSRRIKMPISQGDTKITEKTNSSMRKTPTR